MAHRTGWEKRPDGDEDTAYHEAGHAWVTYWHFVRKGECAGVELTLDDAVGDDLRLGLCMARGIRVPNAANWSMHTARWAAGRVSEGLYAEREGVWAWKEWEESNRHKFDELLTELRESPDEHEGDLAQWFRMGQEHGMPVTLDLYWQGWEEAERLVRSDWETVDQLARAFLLKRCLSEREVLAICESVFEEEPAEASVKEDMR